MSEIKQLNIKRVSTFNSDFLFSMSITVKAIYTDIYKDKKCEAIISFLNGRDISVVKGSKLIIDIDGATFSSILIKDITKDCVIVKTPAKSKIKSDIRKGVKVYDYLILDVFKNKICIRKV